MYKILVLLIVVLLTSFSFGQAPWFYSNTGYVASNIYSFPDTATLVDCDILTGNIVYVDGYVIGSTVGGGFFQALVTSSAVDGIDVLNHKITGKRFVRVGSLSDNFDFKSISNKINSSYEYFEDFIGVELDSAGGGTVKGGVITSTNATLRGWNTTADDGWTLTQAAGTLGGILTVTCDADANDEFYMQLGELGTETYLEYTAASGLQSYIEFEVASTDITASAAGFFIGLAGEGVAAANFFNDSGADFSDVDIIGFWQPEANEDTLEFVYQTTGGTFYRDTLQVIAANTYYTLAMYFDGASTLTYYIDGTAMGTVAMTASLFPDGEELSPIIGVKQGAQARVINLDRIYFKSER